MNTQHKPGDFARDAAAEDAFTSEGGHLANERPERERVGARTVAAPAEADRALMASLGIEFEAGAFRFRGFRYDSLADAVSYARNHQKGSS